MRIHKLYILLGLLLAFGLFFELAAHADEANQATMISFSAPVEIPGQVLPAGTYLFQLANTNGDLNLVQIFNADHSVLYATLQTVATERPEPASDTAITLAEPESGNPALMKWFYPGELIGHQFVYSKEQERAIAQAPQETLLANHSSSSGEAAGE